MCSAAQGGRWSRCERTGIGWLLYSSESVGHSGSGAPQFDRADLQVGFLPEGSQGALALLLRLGCIPVDSTVRGFDDNGQARSRQSLPAEGAHLAGHVVAQGPLHGFTLAAMFAEGAEPRDRAYVLAAGGVAFLRQVDAKHHARMAVGGHVPQHQFDGLRFFKVHQRFFQLRFRQKA